MRPIVLAGSLLLATLLYSPSAASAESGLASWYGEAHRGKFMANGRKFDPDKLTAASWFYPLGTKVRVTLEHGQQTRAILVTITDRGPAPRLIRRKRIIDLSFTAFRQLAEPNLGLVAVKVEREQ